MKTVKAISLGRLGYGKALQVQQKISNYVKEAKMSDTLLIVEHDPVYTVGIRDKSYTKEDEEKLISLGAEFYRTNRGGLITFHGPGQLVAYPILDLRNHKPSIRWYVHALESTIIDLCASYGIKANTSPLTGNTYQAMFKFFDKFFTHDLNKTGPGIKTLTNNYPIPRSVWVDDRKICALGIHASRYVTTHGLALNCNVNLKWFSHIVPCGIKGKFVTSLSEQLNSNVEISEVLPKFKDSFSKIFNCEIVDFLQSENTDSLKELVQ